MDALGVATSPAITMAITIVARAVKTGTIKTASNKFVSIHEVLPWGALFISKVWLMSSYRTLTASYFPLVWCFIFVSVTLVMRL